MRRPPTPASIALRARARGFSLIVGLVIVFAAALLAVGGALVATQNTQSTSGWSDRQRALFVAEGTLRAAETSTQTFVTANLSNLSGAVSAGGTPYIYARANAPSWTPWPTASATSVQIDPSLPNGQYFVVYEGDSALTGSGFVNGSGASGSMLTQLHKFTIYVYANGSKPGTQVILSVHRQYSQ
jgi:hypothetical protein